MHAFLDNAPLPTDRPTLAAALRAAAHEAQRHGRIVVEVFVDGRQADDSLLDHPSDEPIDAEVRLISVNPRALVRQTLLDCNDALAGINEEQLETADLIQSGHTEDALQPLGRAISTWQAIRDALERSTALLLGKEDLDSEPLVELLDTLALRLEEIRAALSREDWSALADVLAYEMPAEVTRWQSTLTSLANRLAD